MNTSSTSLHSNATPPLNPTTPQKTGEAPSWRDYPAGDGHNSITTAGKTLSDRLSGLGGEKLFSNEIDLRVVDIRSNNGRTPLYIANEDFH